MTEHQEMIRAHILYALRPGSDASQREKDLARECLHLAAEIESLRGMTPIDLAIEQEQERLQRKSERRKK